MSSQPPSGLRKAAILLVILGEEAASQIYRNLPPADVEQITREIAALNAVDAETVLAILEEFDRLVTLNAAYREKFGFPFILAVRGYDRHGIIANFETRVNNSRADELRASLDQIYRIARFRLDDLIDA